MKNNSDYYKSIEKICENGAIDKQVLMQKTSMKEVNSIAKMDEVTMISAIDKIKNGEHLNSTSIGIFPLYLKLRNG